MENKREKTRGKIPRYHPEKQLVDFRFVLPKEAF